VLRFKGRPNIVFRAEKGYGARIQKFESFWKKSCERKALSLIEKYTGLRWKRFCVEVVGRRPDEKEKAFAALTDIPKKPACISLFDIKSNRSAAKDLIHELVHSIIWSTYISDRKRVKEMTLFDDIFADELLTELISQQIYVQMGLNKKVDYQEALQYGFETALEKIIDISGVQTNPWRLRKDKRHSTGAAKNLRKEMLDKLEKWFRKYLKEAQKGSTNALDGMKEIVSLFPNMSEHH
jgi:hypothetical protein